MTLRVRPAGVLDVRDMAEIMNDGLARTAGSSPVGTGNLADWLRTAPAGSARHVAEDDAGGILGFQFIEPNPELPPGCCEIATFIRQGDAGLGAGSALFRASEAAARALGYGAIVAVVRRDNESALTYYQSRGFEVWHIREDVSRCPRVVKRYAL